MGVYEATQRVVLKAFGVWTTSEDVGGAGEVPKGCVGGDFDNPRCTQGHLSGRVPTPAPPSLRKVTAPSYHGPDTLPCALLTRCAPIPGVPRLERKEPLLSSQCHFFWRISPSSLISTTSVRVCVLGDLPSSLCLLRPCGSSLWILRAADCWCHERCKQCHCDSVSFAYTTEEEKEGDISVCVYLRVPFAKEREITEALSTKRRRGRKSICASKKNPVM